MSQQSLTDEKIEGTVDHIRYQGDGGWAVVGLEDGTTLTGAMPGVRAGADVTVRGEWTDHPRYGEQFDVSTFKQHTPTDVDGLASWFQRLDGFGPVKARALADEVAGAATIDAATIRVCEATTPELRDRAAEAWQQDTDRRETLVALQGFGMTASKADKAYDRWGTEAPSIVERNPYRMTELPQIGFQTADGLARQMGVAQDDPLRLKAGLAYTLKQARDDGHVGLPRRKLLSAASDELGVRDAKLRDPLDDVLEAGRLVDVDGVLMRSADDADEQTVADRLRSIDAHPGSPWTTDRAEAWLDGRDLSLTDEQREAFVAALTDGGVVTLTGGPGTGKTYTLDAICEAWPDTLHLASPTGRAAKRMEEVIGKSAQTIHRLLEFRPGHGFTLDHESLDGLVVIDETSMLDTMLAARLFERIADSATVLLVGDPDQLPSVGPGYVLQDILDAPVGTSCHLTEIHRQAKGSGIVEVAYRINAGKTPDLHRSHDDLGLVEVNGSAHAKRAVEATVRRLDEMGYGLADDVQILSPMYNSEAGVDALNAMLQTIVHDGDPGGREFGSDTFAPGDRIMQTRNNYDIGVMNGDVGQVVEVASKGEYLRQSPVDDRKISLRVDMDGYTAPLEYTAYEAATELTLAYACTTHKSQGSQYPVAVVVLTSSHWIMCERTLLYTALTRAADFGVLIAEPKALDRACNHHTPVDRHRALLSRMEDL